ncbi:unnamed protein product [Paramecium pentaurelia]|uniref:DH domain-containing protein n=1 Tax=Paramecium pentaurelia TaxID=43138 RepID=A0A8S1UEU8_9CILI|nr:unnamed protein product [Paramecium pentaurelia]
MITQDFHHLQQIKVQDDKQQQQSPQIVAINFNLHDQYQPEIINNTYIIQAFFKMIIQKKKYQILRAQALKRRKAFEELIQTEESYMTDMTIIIEKVVKIVEERQILPQNQIQKAFSNIKQIYDLNSAFLKDLQNKLGIYRDNACISHLLQKYIPFFKIYFQYLQEFKIDQIIILRNEYQDFGEFLTFLEESFIFKGGDLNSFLIKPVQRLPRYSLLLTSILKYTWKDHPDYSDLKQTLNSFALLTQDIDLRITNILKNQVLFELQYKFFNLINVQIVESTRKFILKESLNEDVNLYLCNDLFLITQMNEQTLNKEKLITYSFFTKDTHILINQKSSCSLIILGIQMHLTMFKCKDDEQKLRIKQKFDSIIADLKNNQSIQQSLPRQIFQNYHPIQVEILSITRGQELLKTYAQYNISIRNQFYIYKTQTRHKFLLKMEKMLKIEYKKLSESHLQPNLIIQNWIEDRLNKELNEERKVIVKDFLETLLNSHLVKSKPEYFLRKLRLPLNFYNREPPKQKIRNKLQQIEGLKWNKLI